MTQGLHLDLGSTRWYSMGQERITGFATHTEDTQWIHVDPERAASGPFGTTIAHGFLTLSLLPVMTEELVKFIDVDMMVNYGLDRVRFAALVPVNSRVRGHGELTVTSADDAVVCAQVDLKIEVEEQSKPACIAAWLLRIYPTG